ncbi:MAG: ABC transporter permease [Clostridiales bacterium]|nr:ABC transporter permease [Clostridiales bacterium]
MWTKRIIYLLIISLLIGVFALQVNRAPSLLQYVFAPSAEALRGKEVREGQAEEGAREQLSPFEGFLLGWDRFVEEQRDNLHAAVLSAHYPGVSLQTQLGGSAVGELVAYYGDLHALDSKLLLSGRQLYQEEIDGGKPVAVIDEGLAIALFRQGDPVNMKFDLFNQTFTVVGVTRFARTVGDRAEYGLAVPLKAFSQQPVWEAMSAQLRAKGGAGTRSGLGKSLSQWQQGGQVIDLVKEKYHAILPLRVLLCLLGIALAIAGLRFAKRTSGRLVRTCQKWLESAYAWALMPRFIGVGLIILFMYALGVALLILAFTQLIAPVYVFPEWVPAILVEPKEISATFWNNRTMANALRAFRSRELLYLDALRGYIAVLCALAGALLIRPVGSLMDVFKKQK